MNLLDVLVKIFLLWRQAFKKNECFMRAIQHALAILCSERRNTITQIITTLGRSQNDWTADYKFYSKRKWSVESLFQPIIEQTISFANPHFIAVAADDTKLHKTGKKIPTLSWQRDPMGPPFQTNLIWAQRMLQFTHLLPLYNVSKGKDVPPRSLPIRFIEAPIVRKPGRKASPEELKTYKEEKKIHNLSTLFVQEAEKLRQAFDNAGAKEKRVLIATDGSFCNQICFRTQIERVDILSRCRKDARLYFRAKPESKRFYEKDFFCPEQVRKNSTIPWQTTKIFHGGKWREVQYKEQSEVLWRSGAGRRPLRLFVIRPVQYRLTKNGQAYYRSPAYLLSTDLKAPSREQIQAYFDRWQIEVNHREEKSIIGVGQAQVRNRQSIARQPAFMVAAYSALLLASVRAYGDQSQTELFVLAKWQRTSKRPSCQQLIRQLKKELLDKDHECTNIDIERLLKAIAA